MKRFTVLLVFGFVLSFFITLAHAELGEEWVLTNSDHHIKTYIRKHPGSKLLQFKAISIIDARLENCGMVLRDLSAYPLWMDMCEKASLVSKIDDNNMTVHLLMDFPIVSDRDLVVKADTVYDLEKARGIITLNMVDKSPVPISKGAIRMNGFSGGYILEYITRERTGIIYTYFGDPGGYLPAFAVNIAGKHMLYNTFKNFEIMAKKKKYVEAGANSSDRKLFENILQDTEHVKAILRARLMEWFRNDNMVDRMVADQNIVDYFVNGTGKLNEELFFSWNSREKLEMLLHEVLRVHLRNYTTDNAIVEKIANDQRVKSAIIDGDKPGKQSAMELIQSFLVS